MMYNNKILTICMCVGLALVQGCDESKKTSFPKKVWAFWHSGADSMHDMLKQNIRQMKLMLGKDWEVHVLSLKKDDPEYLGNYLDLTNELPDYFFNLKEKIYVFPDGNSSSIEPVVQSDIVRLALLRKYGGVWMDSSIILNRSLEDTILYKKFTDYNIEVAGYFFENYISHKLHNSAFAFENWFIMAKENSEIIKKWEQAFWEYWRIADKKISIYDSPYYKGEDSEILSVFGDGANYLNQHAAWRKVLYHNRRFADRVYVESAKFGSSPTNPGPFIYFHYYGTDSDDAYRAFTGQQSNDGKLKNLDQISAEFSKANFLKFPSSNLRQIKQEFKTLNDFYGPKDNLFRRLWHKSIDPRINPL